LARQLKRKQGEIETEMMMLTNRTYMITAAALVTLLAWVSPASADSLKDQLMKGSIVSYSLFKHDGDVKPGRAMALVAAPAEVVTQILANVDTYKEFVPRITGSRRVKNGRFVVECNMPWPVNKTWAYVKVNRGIRKGVHTLTWKMTNGTLKRYKGVAWIQPLGKNLSLLTYEMLVVPHTKAPDSMLTKGLKVAVKDMVKAVRKRAKKVMTTPGLRMAATR
jgi:ribosome-associated toxin RatA of RatAB toxin-antitoxin module